MVLATARLLGIAFQHIGQPRVIGEMTAGILLGPSLLGHLARGAFSHLFPSDGLGALNTLSQVGLILFLFSVGLQVHPRETGGLAGPGLAGQAITASVASMLTPLILGALLAIPLHGELSGSASPATFSLFMGAAISITAFPVLARILTERGMLNSRAGAIAISCAAVDDVAAWCLVAFLMAASAAAWLPIVAGLLAYVGAMMYLVRRLLRRCTPNLGVALLLVLASSWTTEALGVHALFGASWPVLPCLANRSWPRFWSR